MDGLHYAKNDNNYRIYMYLPTEHMALSVEDNGEEKKKKGNVKMKSKIKNKS